MSKTLEKIQALAEVSDILISEHGYDQLSNDNLTAIEIVEGIQKEQQFLYFKKMIQGILFILRRGDLNSAVENAMIYELHPLTIESGITQPGAPADARTLRR